MAIYEFDTEQKNEPDVRFVCLECGCGEFLLQSEDIEAEEITISCEQCGEEYTAGGVQN